MGAIVNIPNLHGYMVTSLGDVIGPKGKRKPQVQNNGYLAVGINVNGKRKNLSVHRLVATSFNGQSDLQVNHIDGNKTNNAISNLEFVTPSQNQKHAIKIGLRKVEPIQASGASTGYILFSEKDIKSAGFNSAHVYSCAKGNRKSHKGYRFERINRNTV